MMIPVDFFFRGGWLNRHAQDFRRSRCRRQRVDGWSAGILSRWWEMRFFHHRVHPKFTMNFDRLLWWTHPYQNPNGVSTIPNMAIFKRGIYTIPPFSHGDGDSLCWYLPRHPKTWVQVIARHECKWMVEAKFDWYTYILIYIHDII